jgi:NAD(P)-dependent dehydrogenase (short-subunit alcohol dehydrogenase family)
MTRAAAVELGIHGVRVNAVAPSMFTRRPAPTSPGGDSLGGP